MSPRQKEHALWVACAAAAVVYGIYAGPHIGPIEGAALWASVVAGRAAARTSERRKAAAQVHHHHATALRSAANGMLDAAIAQGDRDIHSTLTYGQAATILRDVADLRDKDKPQP